MPAEGGTRGSLTFHPGNDDVVGWSRDSKQVAVPAARGAALSRTSRTCTRSPINGGQEQPVPTDWGYWGSYSPDGKRLAFNRHPWSGRGSTTAAATPPICG